MNEAKAIEYLSQTFRFDKYEGSDGNYELISNYWGMKFTVRIREFTIFLANASGFSANGAKCSIDSDDDEINIARELTAFIGEVIKDESRHYVYDGTNGILAWPYNCNFAYIKYIKQCFDMNSNESDYEYMGRKLGKNLDNSRKPVDSSMQGQERGIQAIMDEYGCSREEAIEIMNSEVTSGCHGKAKKEDKKEIKSGLMLDESLERFEEFAGDLCDAVIDITIEKMAEYGADKNDAISALERLEPSDPDGYMSFLDSSCHSKAKKKNKKEIKSSVDETELLERGYNGYQVTKDDNGAWCVPELDLRFWAPDELVSYMNDNHSEEDDDWDDEIESSTTRNTTNLNKIFG